jgi:glycosyltransferase involved in cell wall biosynthesis
MLWVIPLEPLEERYTDQWYRWFKDRCDSLSINYQYIDGDILTETVEVGKVLDASGTIYYKASQIKKISMLFKHGKISDGDTFFLFDGQFPGVESIKYMATLYNLKVKVCCYFHAGSYTKEDFTVPMKNWLKFFELAWLNYYDLVFVGTDYHADRLLTSRMSFLEKDNIVTTGTMYNSSEVRKFRSIDASEKFETPTIIFASRFDIEKRPGVLLDLVIQRSEYNFIITTSRKKLTNNLELIELSEKLKKFDNVEIYEGISKDRYYELMSKSHVYLSTSIEENFGICTLEALTLGTSPLLRAGLSNSELVRNESMFLYNDDSDILVSLDCLINYGTEFDFQYLYSKYDKSIDTMLERMNVLDYRLKHRNF